MPRVEQFQPEIAVELAGEGADVRPVAIERKGETWKVAEVLASWAEGGQGPSARVFGRVSRTYFRIRLENGAIYEIAHELPENRRNAARWVLVRQLLEEGQATARSAGRALPSPTTTPPAAGKPAGRAPRQGSAKSRAPAPGARPTASAGGRGAKKVERAARPRRPAPKAAS